MDWHGILLAGLSAGIAAGIAALLVGNPKESERAWLTEKIRTQIIELMMKRLPHASDEAAASYVQVMVTQMNELNEQGGDLCYRFLFPQASGGIDALKYFSKATQEADINGLAQVLKTAAENPQAIPQENDVMPRIEPIFLDLTKEYGDDIAMLQNPGGPNVDRAKVGLMAAKLYSRVLAFPPKESGKIIRFMFSGQ